MREFNISKLFGFFMIVALLVIGGCSSTTESSSGTDSTAQKNSQSNESSEEEKSSTKEKFEFRLGHVFAVDSVTDQGAKHFANLVNQKTDGNVEISVFPAGQLGGDEALGQDLSRGTLDFAFINQGSLAGMDPLLDFHYMPYIAENYEQADQLYYGDGIIPTTMKETLAKHKMRVLGFYELEFRGLTNSKRPVRTLKDMEGLKLRVPGSRAIKGFFEAAGTQPVAIPMPELYTSLQQKTVDGQDNGVKITYDNNLHEPNPYITRTNHVYASGSIVISEHTWSKLPKEYQNAIEEAGKEAQEWQVNKNREVIASYVDKLEEAGIEVIELSTESLNEFKKLGRSLWDDLSDKYGAERIETLREEIKELK